MATGKVRERLPFPPPAGRQTGNPVVPVHFRVVCLTDGSDHADSSGPLPFFGHAFPGVATPALDLGFSAKDATADLLQVILVQPDFGGTVDFAAVVEHETGLIGVEKPVEGSDFDEVARLSSIKIINQLVCRLEPDEFDPVLCAQFVDPGGQRTLFLTGATLVAWPVNQPGDLGVGAVLVFQLLDAGYRTTDKVAPPAVVGRSLEFLPLVEGGTAANHNVLLFLPGLSWSKDNDKEAEGSEKAHKGTNLRPKTAEGKRLTLLSFPRASHQGEKVAKVWLIWQSPHLDEGWDLSLRPRRRRPPRWLLQNWLARECSLFPSLKWCRARFSRAPLFPKNYYLSWLDRFGRTGLFSL